MKIAVIGAGNVGGTLAAGWAKKGHTILIGAREPKESESFAKSIGGKALPVADAIGEGEVVLFSLPWNVSYELAAQPALAGKILIDCANPLKKDFSGLELGLTTSGAEEIQKRANGAKVVKAFNTVGFNVMENPILEGRKAAMFYCGDDSAAKAVVKTLIEDIGFESLDAGPLATARLLEPYALLWIQSAMKFGMGRDFALSVVRKLAV